MNISRPFSQTPMLGGANAEVASHKSIQTTQSQSSKVTTTAVPSSSRVLVDSALPNNPPGSDKLTASGRQLAGYLRGRATLNKVIHSLELESVKASQASLTRTRAALTPANALSNEGNLDVEAYAAHETAKALGRQMFAALAEPDPQKVARLKALLPFEELNEIGAGDNDRYLTMGRSMIMAACAYYAKSGVCDDFSRVGMAAHGPQLKDGQTVAVMESDHPYPHAWMHVRDATPGQQDVVYDGWNKGPTVLAEDSRRLSSESMPVPEGTELNQSESKVMARGVAKLLMSLRGDAGIGAMFQKMHAHQLARLNAFIAHPEGGVSKLMGLYPPMQTTSEKFATDVQDGENKLGEIKQAPLMGEIRSSGVGRAIGLNVRSSTRKENIAEIDTAMRDMVKASLSKNGS